MNVQLIVLQQTIQLSFIQLLFPVFLLAAWYGWRRGWREEAITSVGLIFTLLLFSNETVAQNMAELLNRIVGAFGVFLNALFGGERSASTPLITTQNFGTFQMVAFGVGAVVSYIVGSAVGRRYGVSRGGKLLGAFIGVLNSYIVLSKVLDFWNARRGTRNLPLDSGAQVIVPPVPQDNVLRSNLPTIFALLFLIILVITFFRLPKIRQ